MFYSNSMDKNASLYTWNNIFRGLKNKQFFPRNQQRPDEAIVHEQTLAHANNKQQLGFKIFLNTAKAVHQKQQQDFQPKQCSRSYKLESQMV